MNNLPNLQH